MARPKVNQNPRRLLVLVCDDATWRLILGNLPASAQSKANWIAERIERQYTMGKRKPQFATAKAPKVAP
jgi:hypothetical protein